MRTINWDDFFERKQSLAFSLLVAAYEEKLSSARSMRYGRQVYSVLFYSTVELHALKKAGIDPFLVEDDTPEIIRLNKQERHFYDKLFIGFCNIWLLNRYKPVASFVHDLNEAVANYVVPLLISVDDWETATEAQQKSNNFNSSPLAVQRILRWIIWRFVAIRFRVYLQADGTLSEHLPKQQLLIDEEFESVFVEEIQSLNKRHKLPQSIVDSISQHPEAIQDFLSKKPTKKRRSETIERDNKILNDYKNLLARGISPKVARIQVADMNAVNERTLYRALESGGGY